MGHGPYPSARGRSKQRRARGRSIGKGDPRRKEEATKMPYLGMLLGRARPAKNPTKKSAIQA
jgi:hypothetical protein